MINTLKLPYLIKIKITKIMQMTEGLKSNKNKII